MSFGPTRQGRINFILLVPRFKSSKYGSIPPVLTLKGIKPDGNPAQRGKRGPAAPVLRSLLAKKET
jgi:hypothetical protein